MKSYNLAKIKNKSYRPSLAKKIWTGIAVLGFTVWFSSIGYSIYYKTQASNEIPINQESQIEQIVEENEPSDAQKENFKKGQYIVLGAYAGASIAIIGLFGANVVDNDKRRREKLPENVIDLRKYRRYE